MDEETRADVMISTIIGAFVGLLIFFIFYATFSSWTYLFLVPLAALLSGAQAAFMPKSKKKKKRGED